MHSVEQQRLYLQIKLHFVSRDSTITLHLQHLVVVASPGDPVPRKKI